MAKRKYTEVKLTLKSNSLGKDGNAGRLTLFATVRAKDYRRLKSATYVEIVKFEPMHTEVIR